jgi:membrane-associated phospholipid phosphatase
MYPNLPLEIPINLFFQNLGMWLKPIAAGLSFMGSEWFFILIMPAVYWCIDAGVGFRIGLMLVATNSLNGYLKVLFHSPRPYWVDPNVKALAQETSFGLPSGHSQNSASLWGLAAAKFKKSWFTIVSIAAILFIGVSRLYLGMHFTRDVLCGWAIGGLLIVVFMLLEKPVTSWITKKSLAFQVLFTFFVCVLIIGLGYASVMADAKWAMPAVWTTNAAAAGGAVPDPFNMEGLFTISGVLFGFASGYAWLLKKKGSVVVKGSLGTRVTRYLIGLVGVLVLYLGLKVIFPADPTWLGLCLRFVRYALIGVWVSALAPLLFEKLKLVK